MEALDQRTRAALARIDRALERIDTAVTAEAKPAPEAAELERLRKAHALLRRRVETAIGEIDTMLDAERGEAA
jgi:hypothetical protein